MNEITIVNKELRQQSTAIAKLATKAATATVEIAFRLAYIKSNIDVTEEGFKNIADYAETLFGFKKSTTYNYIKVAERYIEKHENKYNSILYNDDMGKDYTTAQLLELLPVETEKAEEMQATGKISPEMSASAIRKAVKAETEPEQEEPEHEEQEPAEPKTVDAKRVCDYIFDAVKNATCKVTWDFLKGVEAMAIAVFGNVCVIDTVGTYNEDTLYIIINGERREYSLVS